MLVSRGPRRVALTVTACTALLLAGCGANDESPAEDVPPAEVHLYGSDGNMQNWFAQELGDQAELLRGMKGTTPLTRLSEDFKRRLHDIDPKLNDYLYAAESYDAVAISAIAAQLAGTTKPAEIAKQIIGVTNGGERCDSIARCLELARDGEDVAYRGASLTRAGFTDVGEPSTASYGTLHFGMDSQLDEGKTEYLGAGDESTASAKEPPTPKRQTPRIVRTTEALKLGGLLPKTGDLALAYPPMVAGVKLALQEINDAGGVLGKDVVWVDGDDGTNPATAKATVARHIENGVHVIIGAGASGISRAVLPDVIRAGVVLFSPSNTDAGLSTVDDKGLYFRTAPSDILQGRALADMILRDGARRVAVVARRDSYGEGLQANVRAELERAGHGGPDQLRLFTYEPPAGEDAPPVDFAAGAQEIKQFGADAVLIIGFGESAKVIQDLAAAGLALGR